MLSKQFQPINFEETLFDQTTYPGLNSQLKNINPYNMFISFVLFLVTECPLITRCGCRSHVIESSRKSSFRPERQITDKPLLYFGTFRVVLAKPRCSSSRFVENFSQWRKRILVLQRDSETGSACSERHLPVATKVWNPEFVPSFHA